MRILLLGEYSNVHATLAEGLRALGNEVVVASNGDFWKDYPRDIDLKRIPGKVGGARLYIKVKNKMAEMRDFDVVQLINPMFLELKAERIEPFYKQLRSQNGKMFLGAFGMDYYWAMVNSTTMPLRYSDFNIGNQLRTNADALKERADWIGTPKEELNKLIADDCDGIIAGLYEYYATYQPLFPAKTTFIPFPIKPEEGTTDQFTVHNPVRIFIGISKGRSKYKGTDIMLRAALEIEKRYPNEIIINKVEGVPFAEYRKLMEGSDVILDQLYSYTPSMNSLLAMNKGIVCVGGAEPENYEILGEKVLRPIVNVEPNYKSVVEQLEWLITIKRNIPRLKKESVEYVHKHHDYIKVAQQYIDFWTKQ